MFPAEKGERATHSMLSKGSFSGLPTVARVVQVYRSEAKRARLEGTVTTVLRNKVNYGARCQKGSASEKLLLTNLRDSAKGKSLLIFADLFGGAGDRLQGFYEMLKSSFPN